MSYIGNTVENQNYVPAIDYFNGDGSTVAFTLSRPVASVAAVQAVISNVPQNPGSAFTVSGSTITFTSAPPSGTANIYVYYTSPNTQVVQPGQGTIGTIQIADSAVTTAKIAAANVTQAKLASGVAGNGPAFSASGSDQSVSAGATSKLAFNSEAFDTANCYDPTTNYRFTPNVAGYYLVSGISQLSGTQSSGQYCNFHIYKNGALLVTPASANSTAYGQMTFSYLMYMNGTTDYVELYMYTTNTFIFRLTAFQAHLARAA